MPQVADWLGARREPAALQERRGRWRLATASHAGRRNRIFHLPAASSRGQWRADSRRDPPHPEGRLALRSLKSIRSATHGTAARVAARMRHGLAAPLSLMRIRTESGGRHPARLLQRPEASSSNRGTMSASRDALCRRRPVEGQSAGTRSRPSGQVPCSQRTRHVTFEATDPGAVKRSRASGGCHAVGRERCLLKPAPIPRYARTRTAGRLLSRGSERLAGKIVRTRAGSPATGVRCPYRATLQGSPSDQGPTEGWSRDM